MYQHEADALKRDLERLRLEMNLEKESHLRTQRIAAETRDSLATAQGEIGELRERVGQLEMGRPSSTAELLMLASTRAAGLLALIANSHETVLVAQLEAVTKELPGRTISTNGVPYLTRWYLWPEGPRDIDDEGSDLPFAVFLHKFHRGDADRDQHNHPWDLSVAIVLAGGYREERSSSTKVFTPGMVNVIRGNDFHRVDLLDPAKGSWSLFIAGRKTRGWGFKDAASGVVTPWQTYLASKAMKTPVTNTGDSRQGVLDEHSKHR